jgi:hypothetical protein
MTQRNQTIRAVTISVATSLLTFPSMIAAYYLLS